jgi:hypothetical protein
LGRAAARPLREGLCVRVSSFLPPAPLSGCPLFLSPSYTTMPRRRGGLFAADQRLLDAQGACQRCLSDPIPSAPSLLGFADNLTFAVLSLSRTKKGKEKKEVITLLPFSLPPTPPPNDASFAFNSQFRLQHASRRGRSPTSHSRRIPLCLPPTANPSKGGGLCGAAPWRARPLGGGGMCGASPKVSFRGCLSLVSVGLCKLLTPGLFCSRVPFTGRAEGDLSRGLAP